MTKCYLIHCAQVVCKNAHEIGFLLSTESTYVVANSVLILLSLLPLLYFEIYFRQSFRESISIMAECIETQLMPISSLGRDC